MGKGSAQVVYEFQTVPQCQPHLTRFERGALSFCKNDYKRKENTQTVCFCVESQSQKLSL